MSSALLWLSHLSSVLLIEAKRQVVEQITQGASTAIVLGHPIGASGTHILVTLFYEVQMRNAHLGLATLCSGGGQGVVMIVEF